MRNVHPMLPVKATRTHAHTQSYLALPVSAVDQDKALWESRVRQQNLVQLVVHHLPQELHTNKQRTRGQVHKPPDSNTFPLQMTHQHTHNSFLSSYQDAFFTLRQERSTTNNKGKGSDSVNPSATW